MKNLRCAGAEYKYVWMTEQSSDYGGYGYMTLTRDKVTMDNCALIVSTYDIVISISFECVEGYASR